MLHVGTNNTLYGNTASDMDFHLLRLLRRIWEVSPDGHVILSCIPPRAVNLHDVENDVYNLDERKEEIGRYVYTWSTITRGCQING